VNDEEFVKSRYPDAQLYGYPHGKVRIQAGEVILSIMMYKGTREQRRDDAWKDAAERERLRVM
jgi:hypothetical protein